MRFPEFPEALPEEESSEGEGEEEDEEEEGETENELQEQGGADVGPAHHAGHGLGVHRVRREDEAREQVPRRSAQQGATEGGEEAGDGGVEPHVDQVVAPRPQAVQGVVEAEGERTERSEGLVAAAVGEQGAPEVVIEDVGPRRLWKQVLVGLDRTAVNEKRSSVKEELFGSVVDCYPCLVYRNNSN